MPQVGLNQFGNTPNLNGVSSNNSKSLKIDKAPDEIEGSTKPCYIVTYRQNSEGEWAYVGSDGIKDGAIRRIYSDGKVTVQYPGEQEVTVKQGQKKIITHH